MKKFVKKSIAVACTAALLSGGVYPIATNAEQTVLQPKITGSWQKMEDGSRKAGINVSYDKQYSGYKSITALYDTDGKLLSCGMGTLDENGSASYEVNDTNADKAAHYIWNFETLEPAGGAYKTTYADFVNSIGNSVPEFNVTEGLGIRHSFESGRFQIFQAKDTYNVAIADDVSASTGVKCAKISNRSEENATLRIKLQASDISGGTILNVSADMKKPNNITDDAEFYITVIPVGHSKDAKSSTPMAVTDNEWHNVSYSVTLSDLGTLTSGCVVQLGARTGSAGAYKYIDYYADDFTITSDTTATVIYDDIKVGGMKWDFEDGVATDWVTTNYKETNIDERDKLDLLRNANNWTYVIKYHIPAVEKTSDAQFCNTVSTTGVASVKTPDSDAVTTPPEGSKKMLSITEVTDDGARTHISTRIKLSKWDLVPGKTYNMSFWAFGNSKKRALYTGLLKHEGTIAMPNGFSGGYKYSGVNKYDKSGKNKIEANTRAPGIIQYDDYPPESGKTDYLVNYVASMPRSWHKYTVTFTPKAGDFDSDGYTNLYFVMAWDRPNSDGWYDKDMLKGEKLYLDEIEITEADTTPGEVAEITNDGLYTKRATFETDSMDMFAPNAKTKSTITNETAHTGEYSVMYTGREGNWETLVTSLKGADPTSTITASCYLRNYYPTKSGTEAKFRLLLPEKTEDGSNRYVYSDSVRLDGAIWTELKGIFDLSDYPEITEENIYQVNIDIVTTPEKSSYYADDFMLKSDKAGTFIDDYTLINNDDSISKTATSETYKAVDLDTGITSLYTKYADKFKIGGTLANDVVTSASARNVKIYNKLFKKHFNTTASDGYFKMEEILKNPEAPDDYTFNNADKIMKFCYDNGVTDIVGHALIWDKEGTEKYFYDEYYEPKYTRDGALEFMQTYIETVMNHFNGKGDPSEYSVDGYENWNVNTWDVVNEAVKYMSDDIIFCKGTGFNRAIGADYGKYAFKYARKADSDAELRYNDYGEQNADKADTVCAYVKTLTDPDDPSVSYVNKIGVQSHYDIESDIDTIKQSLDKYAAISSDIKIDITELDIKAYTKEQRDAKVPIYENGIPKSVEYKQAKLLRDLFDKYELMSDKIDRVNFWTFSDLYAYPNREGFTHKEYAGIFDRKFAPKPQYYILVDTPEEFNARYPDYSTYITN